jgi:hypothetical protein
MIAGAVELYVWFCAATMEANRMSESEEKLAERHETLTTPMREFGRRRFDPDHGRTGRTN